MTLSQSWQAAFPPLMWLLPLVAAALCSLGFKKYVWFISIGYGLAVAGQGVCMLAMFGSRLSLVTVLVLLALIFYALRLGGYLLFRELKSASYQKEAKKITKNGKDIPMAAKISIWVTVSLQYTCQVSPIYYRLANGGKTDWSVWLGLCIMLLGLVLEGLADKQKSDAKAKNPERFCDKGLYTLVRCPNYLGELLLWLGVLVSGASALTGVFQWIVALIGFIAIFYVLLSGSRRLELRQSARYGSDPEYQRYVKTTPIFLPFIPVYSMADWKFIIV